MWKHLLNFIGYQAVWFALVIGASRGTTTWPIVAGIAFVVLEIGAGSNRQADLRRLIVAIVLSMFVDGVPALLDLWHYASPAPALPPGGAPLWIMTLWACFATTIGRSLAFVQAKLWLGALLGGVGGPLAYLAAAHGWAAITFTSTPAVYLGWLAVMWAIAVPLLVLAGSPARPRSRAGHPPAPPASRR